MAILSSGANVQQSDSMQSTWTAQMVRPASDLGVDGQMPFLRKTFKVAGTASEATLRISALGLYRCFINGKRVGHDQLTPGWTSYFDRLSFQTYDVSSLLQPGENVIDIWLGNGWYRSPLLWPKARIVSAWGDHLAAIAELRCGNDIAIVTDESWKSGLTPVLKSGIYFGEIYDARLENLVADQGSAIDPEFNTQRLLPHEIDGVKELPSLPVVTSFIDPEGRTVYDFGQNIGGYVAFTVEGESGSTILVEHSEILEASGNFNNENYRSAEARIEYTLKGEGIEAYRPFFTFQGFRYARVTVHGAATIRSITSVPISSATQRTGWLTTSNALVNRLVENTLWSQRGNFIEVPTDCPQRDERMGWTGDAQVFVGTACYLFESRNFWKKWLRDVMADQRAGGEIPHFSPDPTRNNEDIVPSYYGSTGWGDAICVVPWTLWAHYGDKGILEECFPAMVRWVDFVWSISDGPIVQPPRDPTSRGFSFGDWLQPSGPTEKPFPTIGDDAAATIYLHIASKLVAKVAGVLGRKEEEIRFIERAERVKAAFAHEFIAPSGRLVYDDQTSYALAIMHDLIPVDKLEAAKRYFKATIARAGGRIGTGFIGTPALLPALVKIGEIELAASVFLQEETPGWLYQVKTGATTIWERWDAIRADGQVFDPAMNSYNHYAYGAVCQWLFESAAGFRPDTAKPGFTHIVFEPTIIPALSPLNARHDSIAGPVEASWVVKDNQVSYRLTIPTGSSGTLVLKPEYTNRTVDGQPFAKTPGGIALSAGSHEVSFLLS